MAAPDPPAARPLDMRLLVPALASWAAVAATLALSSRWLLGLSLATVLAAAGCLRWRRLRQRAWAGAAALSLLAVGLCLLAAGAHTMARNAGPVPGLAAQQASARLEALVVTEPRVVARGDERATDLVIVRLEVQQVAARGVVSEPRTPVLVFGDSDWQHLRWRERIAVSGRFSPADPGQDVAAVLNPYGAPQRLAEPGLVLRGVEHVRTGLRAAVDPLPRDARGLVPGLVIGDTSLTPPGLTEAMLDTGMSHLSAVSGSNVAIVLGAAMLVCAWLRVPRRWRPAVALVCLVGFVMLCRPEPSVLRAGAMGVVGLVSLSTSRRSASLPALSTAVIVLLCVDPWLARSYGFALSTLATLGLVFFARPWGQWFARYLPRRLAFAGYALAIPVAAQVMCAPVVVLLQGSVSTVAVLANLLAAPLVAPTTVVGVVTALLAVVSVTVASAVAWLAALPAMGIGWIARACADVPMGMMPWPDGALGAWLLTGLTALAVFAGPWLVAVARSHPYAAGGLALLLAGAAWPTGSQVWPPAGWQLVACDVGQGDGFVLATGAGRAVVVDAGPDPEPITGCLRRLRVQRVDGLVITHFHADHAGGAAGILERWPVREVHVTPVREPPHEAQRLHDRAERLGVPVREVRAGDELAWGPVRARVVWPGRLIRSGSVANNASIVLDVDAAGLRVLFTGDIEPEAARAVRRSLQADGDPGGGGPGGGGPDGFDVLKVAHHGSSAQDEQLVAGLGARLALISVGQDNDYGHPAPSLLRLLRESDYQVERTDLHGDVAVSQDGSGRVMVSRGG